MDTIYQVKSNIMDTSKCVMGGIVYLIPNRLNCGNLLQEGAIITCSTPASDLFIHCVCV